MHTIGSSDVYKQYVEMAQDFVDRGLTIDPDSQLNPLLIKGVRILQAGVY